MYIKIRISAGIRGSIPDCAYVRDLLKVSKWFFCKKKGHMKKEFPKLKIHLEKKDTEISFICYESNMVDVCDSTWWIDSSTTICISNTLQGFLN